MSTDAVPDPKPELGAENLPENVADPVSPNEDNIPTTMLAVGGGTNRAYITVFVLFVINLLNYMDRLTVAGRRTKYKTVISERATFNYITFQFSYNKR